MSSLQKIKIGITIGDIGGIGPELLIKTFEDPRWTELCQPIVYGSESVLNYYKTILNNNKTVFYPVGTKCPGPGAIPVIECMDEITDFTIGAPSEIGGRLAYHALETALKDWKTGRIDLLVTLPIDKHTIQNEKFKYPGHTEFLTQFCNMPESLMLMVHDNLRVAVTTGHIPVREITNKIHVSLIMNKLRILNDTLRYDFSIPKPKIALLGLNPHAGDNGTIGTEEIDIHFQVLEKARKENWIVMGPYPADGYFAHNTWKKFDATLAMYHDQGLIPFKVIASGNGVNFTAGLPIIRTSPDHGTAYDIAGKNKADETSFREAIYLAIDIFRKRNENLELLKNALDRQGIGNFDLLDEEIESIIE